MAPDHNIAVDDIDDLPDALRQLELTQPRPVIVVVGGAATLSESDAAVIEPLLRSELLPLCDELGAAVIDGGTDSGVMRLMGRARGAAHGAFPLIGVVAVGTIEGPAATVDSPAALEPNHTGFILVPGESWGDESPWLTRVASSVAAGKPVVGVLIQGGDVSLEDVKNLFDAGYPVLALRGTGRLADELTEPANSDRVAVETLRSSPLLHTLDATGTTGQLADALRRLLSDPT